MNIQKKKSFNLYEGKNSWLYIFVYGQLQRSIYLYMENTGGVRKGAWTYKEDELLKACINTYGEGKWNLVPQRSGMVYVLILLFIWLIVLV